MHIHELTEREPLTSELLALWERSVRATHHFLSDAEITAIKEYVPQALLGVPHLIVAQDDLGKALGFIGIAEKHLEMLFLGSLRESGGDRGILWAKGRFQSIFRVVCCYDTSFTPQDSLKSPF